MKTCENCGISEVPDRFSPPEVVWYSEADAMLCCDCIDKLESCDEARESFEVSKFHHDSK